MDRFMTAQEIADAAVRLGLSCMQHTKQSVNRRAKTEGWSEAANLSRPRGGAQGGGGREYHVSLLPQPMQAALIAEVSKDVAQTAVAIRQNTDVAKREALDTTALTSRQRDVMNARSAILTAIENKQIANGMTRSATVGLFITDDDGFGLDVEVLIAANDRRKSAKFHRATILRWFQYRDEGGIGALAPKATKERTDVPAWFWDFLKHYARPQKPCITEALDDFLKAAHGINEEVTYGKVRRLIAQLGNVEKHRGREGRLTLKARMAYVTRSTGDLLPGCVYTADGKTFDAEIAHPFHGRPFRPEITSVVDVATRKCVGFSVGLAENAEGVVDALRHACEAHGVPAIFYVDRGSGFKNKRLDAHMTGLMGRLGITKHHSLPQNSQARGLIERFHGTVWNKLAREYQTYVGVEMDREARQKSFKVTRKQIREIGASASLPSWEEFLEACNWAIAAYNDKPHASLPDRMSPNQYWQHHVQDGFEPVTVTAAESDDLFRPYVRRRTRRALIEFKTNQYFHIALEEFDGDDVLVGYDIHNADHIWVREIETVKGEDQPGRLICVAKFAGNEARYVPLTAERDAMERRAAARKRRLEEKLDEVEAELNPTTLLNHRPEVPLEPIAPAPAEQIVDAEFEPIAESELTGGPVRFRSDAEFAAWAIEHPDELSAGQIEVLSERILDPLDRQILKDSGVDINALRDVLLRAA